MDRHELNRMFDALTPAPGREEELLNRLFQDDARRKKPMKNWKRVVVAAAAAALLVTGAAAATVPGLSQKLLEYLGVAPEDSQTVELLAPGAMTVDITTESNGAMLHVTQIYWDRTCVRVLADFTAPEGTVLDMGDFDDPKCWGPKGFISKEWVWPYFLDAEGNRLEDEAYGSYRWKVLKDDNRLDNRCSMILEYDTHYYTGTLLEDAAAMWVPARDLYYFVGGNEENETVYAGDWSFEVPLPQKDIGYFLQADRVIGTLDGVDIRLEKMYLSPMTLELTLVREGTAEELWAEGNDAVRWNWFCLTDKWDSVTLTARDGTQAALERGSGGGGESAASLVERYYLEEVTDPAVFQGGTLSLKWNGDTVTIPLDGLTPVEPYPFCGLNRVKTAPVNVDRGGFLTP